MRKTKIAVIGVGIGGKIHINSIRNNSEVELDSVVAPNSEANKLIAKNANVPLFHTLKESLEKRKPDGVIIASPNHLHLEQAKMCIYEGIPILLEKPITMNTIEGLELCNIANKSKAKILVGHHRAHNPVIKKACDVIKEGKLGTLVSVMGSAQYYKPDHYFEEGPWRKKTGGGPILINLIHEIDNLRRLVGEISEVHAYTSNRIRGFEVEDTAVINFIFKNGVLGSFVLSDTSSSSRSWEQTSGENPKYPRYKDDDCYLISGTMGSLAIPSMKLKYYPGDINQSWWKPFNEDQIIFKTEDPIALQLKHFIDIINKDVNPIVTVQDGYINLLITEAIKESAKKGSIVKIDCNTSVLLSG
jgi:predicted dehydrogenase